MTDWFLCRDGLSSVPIHDGLRIGRSTECDVRINDGAVTRVHCRVRLVGGELTLHDESRYGTLVNGQRVAGQVRLGMGDVIDICGHVFTVQRDAASAAHARPRSLHDGDVSDTGELSPASLEAYRRSAPPQQSRLHVDVVEDPRPASRFRDAVQLSDRRVLLVMTDAVTPAPFAPAFLAELKASVRRVGSSGGDASAILENLSWIFLEAQQAASGVCALADPEAHVVSVALAGAESPWILRGGARIVRSQTFPSAELGRVRGAQFPSKLLHFGKGDTLLVPSQAWNGYLTQALVQDLRAPIHAAAWLRQVPHPPAGGSVLCLTFA